MNNYNEFIINFKSRYTHISAIIISLSVIMWFRGIIGLLDYYIISKYKINGCYFIILLAILILFLMGDGLNPVFDVKQRELINKIKNNSYSKNKHNDFTLLTPNSHTDLYF